MIIAQLETRNFSFLSLGNTEDEAKTAMRKAWQAHKKQTGATYTWSNLEEDVSYETLEAGQALRDGWLIVS